MAMCSSIQFYTHDKYAAQPEAQGYYCMWRQPQFARTVAKQSERGPKVASARIYSVNLYLMSLVCLLRISNFFAVSVLIVCICISSSSGDSSATSRALILVAAAS